MASLKDDLQLAHGPAWPNRLVLAPLTNQQSNADGSLHDDELGWLEARAAGGFGTVLTCAAHVARSGQAFPGQLGVWSDEFLPGLSRLARCLRDSGAGSAIQLHHGGLRGRSELSGEPLVAPWDDPGSGARALTLGEIREVVADFVSAAIRAEEAGFDGVEVHGAHGYLLGQFLDARHNHRTDGYGGSYEHRSRVIFEVLEGIREATGPSFQVGLRLSPEGYGISLAEGRDLAQRVMLSGLIDYLDMSLWDVSAPPRRGGADGSSLLDAFVSLPRGRTRFGVAGKILSGRTAQTCLDKGADFVLVGRAAIFNRDFAARVLADLEFACAPGPVPRCHLESQNVGPAFIEYLARSWDDFVV